MLFATAHTVECISGCTSRSINNRISYSSATPVHDHITRNLIFGIEDAVTPDRVTASFNWTTRSRT